MPTVFLFLVARVHPHIVESSLPNLIRNEPDEVSGENGQISLSVSCDNEKSRSTRCSTHYLMSVKDGNISDKTLSSCAIEQDISLEVFRKIRIAA